MRSIFLLLFIPATLWSQNPSGGIDFDTTKFASLLSRAKKENKLVFIDAYTTWCGPCKWMVKNVFPNDTAGRFYNKNFVNAKIDMEKGEGVTIAKKYEVSCYPTYLFLDGDGNLVHRVSSAMSVREFVMLGELAMQPERNFSGLKKKYESPKRTEEDMANYVLARGKTCLPVKDELPAYFATQKETDLISRRNWEILYQAGMSIDVRSREFQYVAAHRKEFVDAHGEESVDFLITMVYGMNLKQLAREQNETAYQVIRKELADRAYPFSEEIVLNSDMAYYKQAKNWVRYAEAAELFVKKHAWDNYSALNNIAWAFYENVDDKKLLARAEEWAKRSVELQAAYYNYDTYASVLYKLGKKQEAITAAEKAIELAKKEGEDFKDTEKLLEKIKALP